MKTSALIFTFLISISTAQAGFKMAITVDDLPVHMPMPAQTTREKIAAQFVAVLKKHKVPEVYGFINAGHIEDPTSHLEVLKMWRSAGYPLGNHTFSHMSLNKNPVGDFIKEIDTNEPLLKELSGNSDWKYFRYPFLHEGDNLEKRNLVRTHLAEKKYRIAQVTVDFNDWAWNKPYARCMEKKKIQDIEWLKESYLQNAKDVLIYEDQVAQAVFKRPIAHILLLHIGALDAEVLDQMLTNYEKQGVTFIPLSEAVKDKAYNLDPGQTHKWGAEFQFQIMKSRGQTLQSLGIKPYTGYPEAKLESLCNE
jgi:peptidoglycan/xylan/chitin deacetylase (PgdA/CDA1 family)